MTPTFLPGLSPSEQKREKIRKRVRPTSRGQYAVGREKFRGRKANVLRWLAAFYNRWQQNPTSAELADYSTGYEMLLKDWMSLLLYVRRGLSDLQAAGLVESVPHGDRKCAVTESKCCTWRVRQR